jgi:hypothetical protein
MVKPMRQVWITEEAYDIVRLQSFQTRKSIGTVLSDAVMNGVKE